MARGVGGFADRQVTPVVASQHLPFVDRLPCNVDSKPRCGVLERAHEGEQDSRAERADVLHDERGCPVHQLPKGKPMTSLSSCRICRDLEHRSRRRVTDPDLDRLRRPRPDWRRRSALSRVRLRAEDASSVRPLHVTSRRHPLRGETEKLLPVELGVRTSSAGARPLRLCAGARNRCSGG